MHPILFTLRFGTHAIPVHAYGLLLAIALVVAVVRTCAVAERRSKDGSAFRGDDVFDAGIWLIVCGLIGARLLFVAFDWSSYKEHPLNALRFWEGGISFHGALFGGFLALVVFCRRRKLSILRIADLFAPSVILAYAIGRIGCFFNGCCYGMPTTMPWGVSFFDDGAWTPPSHPTQLYAAALSLVFFGFLVLLERRKRFDGQVFFWYVLAAAVERFVMEIWRAGVTSTVYLGGITDVQILCLSMGILAVIGLQVMGRRSRAGVPGSGPVRVSQP